MFEYAIKMLKEAELKSLDSIKYYKSKDFWDWHYGMGGNNKSPHQTIKKHEKRMAEIEQAISILEENQTFFGMKIILKEDMPKDEIWFSKDNKTVGIFKILEKEGEKCP